MLPRCIGVVSSPSGAAIRDILRVLKRRFANVRVQLYPVKVQGDGAAVEIAAALRYFSRARSVDVVIVARGGGSLEDLWAFNEEIVARAIAASEIPVITGVGHETDFTIADFVADLRAPTPSAAAEIVLRSRQEFDRQIVEHQRHLVHHIRYLLSERRHRVRDLQTHRGFRQLEALVRQRRQHVDDLAASLGNALRTRFVASRQRLTKAGTRIAAFDLRRRAEILRRRIDQQRTALRAALERLVTRKQRRFAAAHVRFARMDLRARVGRLRHALDERSSSLRIGIDRALIAKRRRYEAVEVQLARAQSRKSPAARLRHRLRRRGESPAFGRSGRVGEDISVRLARGQLDATVRRKKSL